MDERSFDSIGTLPVSGRREDILRAVDDNQVTIITAETGAGKSTQVPQFLAEQGHGKVIVTQPRILAARNLCARVRQEYSWRQGRDCTGLVGYRTAHERDDSPDNIILYCTDGLQLVRELTGSGTRDRQVLILDEVHEWNENMEVLIAWAKKRCTEDPDFKIVLMSATIETESLVSYFSAPPPIMIEGRSYGVDKRHGSDIINEILDQMEAGVRNQLVFLPGKAEIEAVGEAIAAKAELHKVPVIPLHSQLEPESQQLAFASHPNGKVVLTTNVAQTSVTIDDIDVVIDSGLERRAEVRNGVEGLFISEISRADCLQRAGRAGRTRPGQYILAPYDLMPCSRLDDRQAYGVPEIMRKHIDRLVLRLANIGIDIEDLEFYHSPSRRTIKQAKRTLVSLGALTRAGEVTDTGRRMERFPVESGYARMLVQSEACADTIRAKLAAIIAIQEVGGIVKGGPRYSGWRRYTQQNRSDLLAQYDVYLALPSIPMADHEELGIIAKNVSKTEEVIGRLHQDIGLHGTSLEPVREDETEALLRCIVAGQLHQLWTVSPDGEATHIADKSVRELSSTTVVKHAGLVAGTPFDLEIATPKGLETLELVNDVTAVDPLWLEELAPGQFEARKGKTYFDPAYGTLAVRTLVTHNGRQLETAGTPLLDHTPANRQLFVTLYAAWLHDKLEVERRDLQAINHRKLPAVPLREVQSAVRQLAGGAVSLLELPKKQRIELSRLGRMETYIDKHTWRNLETEADRRQQGRHGRRHFGWQPFRKRGFRREKG